MFPSHYQTLTLSHHLFTLSTRSFALFNLLTCNEFDLMLKFVVRASNQSNNSDALQWVRAGIFSVACCVNEASARQALFK